MESGAPDTYDNLSKNLYTGAHTLNYDQSYHASLKSVHFYVTDKLNKLNKSEIDFL